MFGLSLSEIVVVIIVCIIVVKPKDIPTIIKYFRKFKILIKNLQSEFYHVIKDLDSNITNNSTANNTQFFEEQVQELNYYLEKIHDSGIRYNGDYEINEVKTFYFKKLKKIEASLSKKQIKNNKMRIS